MHKNSSIQNPKSEFKGEVTVTQKLQCICSKCNEPFERLAFEEYCYNCLQKMMRS